MTVSVTLTNTMPPGVMRQRLDTGSAPSLPPPAVGMAYALLRHRVVDVSIVVDRALVIYGTVTALVVGMVAAINAARRLKLALPPGAGILGLQVVIPPRPGHRARPGAPGFLDRVVEQRVFFRRKYLAEKALGTFARHAEPYPGRAQAPGRRRPGSIAPAAHGHARGRHLLR